MAYTPTLWTKGDIVTSEKLNKIEQGIVNKVDKETGKTLSTNDFTDAYKTKLDGIEANADKTTIDATLTNSGAAAEAKATGDAIKDIESNLDEKVENLKSLVGTPLKATTASAMTDTSKIYVYTGSESGYINGDWYYHDGSAWVDGGTYNSVAVEVDKTLMVDGMPADAKKTGDLIFKQASDISYLGLDVSNLKKAKEEISTDVSDLKSDLSERTKNLLTTAPISKTAVDVSIEYDGNGTYTISGTATSSGGRTTKVSDTIVLPAGTYTLSAIPSTTVSNLILYLNKTSDNSGFKSVRVGSVVPNTFTLEEETSLYAGFGFVDENTYNVTVKVQLESGSTATGFVTPKSARDAVARADIDVISHSIDEINSTIKQFNTRRLPISLLTDWVRGEWNGSTINTNITSRVSSNHDFTTDGDLTVYIADNYSLYLSKKSGNSYSGVGWKTGEVVINGTYRFIIRNDSAQAAIADIEQSTSAISVSTSLQDDLDSINSINQKISGIDPSAYSNVRDAIVFTIADITSNAGENYGKLGNVKYRLSSKDILQFDYDITIRIADGFKINYYLYESTSSETAIAASNWKTEYKIPVGTCFRLQLARDPESSSSTITDPIDNDLYRAVEISVSENDIAYIPEHWKSTILEKEAAINEINETMGGNGVSFIFLTDYHQNSSNKVSTSLIKHIFDNTSIDTMVYGGDTTDGIGTTAQCLAKIKEYAKEVKQFNCLNVRGNHDCEPTANTTTNQISDAQYYDACVRSLEKITNTGGKPYYYYDNVSQKVRYIILDSGGLNNPLNATQLGWLKERLTELTSGWTVLIFQHWAVSTNSEAETMSIGTRGTAVLDAIGDVYKSLNCEIAAFICGHCHVDGAVDTDYNFKVIATTCDSGGANAAYDWVNPTRQKGTTEDCAFDVFSVDTSKKTITITRIGAGSDREFSY